MDAQIASALIIGGYFCLGAVLAVSVWIYELWITNWKDKSMRCLNGLTNAYLNCLEQFSGNRWRF